MPPPPPPPTTHTTFLQSWLEQKAVLVLLALLHLGVKNIRIGPTLPAFVTPKTLDFLSKTFNLMPIAAEATDGDVDAVMGRAAVKKHAHA